MTDLPWTKRQLQAALRAAGWVRIEGPGSAYIRDGHTLYLDTAIIVNGKQTYSWQRWAEARQVPPPFPPPF